MSFPQDIIYMYTENQVTRMHVHTGICTSTHSSSHADNRSWLKITHTWLSSVWQIGSYTFALLETQREMVYQTAFLKKNYSHIAFTDKDKGVRTDKSSVVASIDSFFRLTHRLPVVITSSFCCPQILPFHTLKEHMENTNQENKPCWLEITCSWKTVCPNQNVSIRFWPSGYTWKWNS